METKKFTMIDEKFICLICEQQVNPLGYTARDHCPSCLCSIHVDINPGDRASQCLGTLKPINIENAKKGKYKIVYQCQKCKMIKRNIAAIDDDLDMIINIMKREN